MVNEAKAARKAARRSQTAVVQGADPKVMQSIRAARHEIHVEVYPGMHPRRQQRLTVIGNNLAEILAKQFLIHALKQRFLAVNPGVGVDLVDWQAFVSSGATFSEGLEVMKRNYPGYEWGRR